MAIFESTQAFPVGCGEVFEFFLVPANQIMTSPPELQLTLEEAPERLSLGARVRVRGRRWGLAHRMVSEVIQFEPEVLLVQEQLEGAFRKWIHTFHFESTAEGTCVTECIDFEPPGGILGLTMTRAFILRDLEWIYTYRRRRLEEVLAKPSH